MSAGRVLVYGGKGSLGSAIIEYFKEKNYWIINVDLAKNNNADTNILVNPTDCWIEQESNVMKGIESTLGTEKLDGILCVAGGWAGGNAANNDFIKNADLMWKQSVWTSSISARLAPFFLKPGGLLQLTGAAAAIEGTPSMMGYGMAKAAVHQLVKSIAADKSSMPPNATVLAILPITLDTPMNRKWMAKADFSNWTSLTFLAEQLHKWITNNQSRPSSGSLLKLHTINGETEIKSV